MNQALSTQAAPDGTDVLARICAQTRQETARRQAECDLDTIRTQALASDKPRGFGVKLKDTAARMGTGLIAEIKRASPSGGLIRSDFDPAALAGSYAASGAACLSVLTDGPFFQGSPDDLRAVRAACDLPLLRKDFILEPWQVYESRVMGADCILLIMAALTDDQARALELAAREVDLDVLVEIHDRAELDRALGLQTSLVGINNRNLKTLRTDLATTEELAEFVTPDRFLIAESGICTHDDVRRLMGRGVCAFLVGESLLRQDDVGLAVKRLLGTAPQA